MSDEPKRPLGTWLIQNWVPVVLFLVAYQATHYATAAAVDEPGFCCQICAHKIAGKRIPESAEALFIPANLIDSVLGINAYRDRSR
jgi:hypothetical protein